jgi:hypothetical protein
MADTLRLPRAVALLVVGALALAACDDDDSTAQGIETLGDDFVRAFNQDPNERTGPLDANDVDLTLTPTIEPFDP